MLRTIEARKKIKCEAQLETETSRYERKLEMKAQYERKLETRVSFSIKTPRGPPVFQYLCKGPRT